MEVKVETVFCAILLVLYFGNLGQCSENPCDKLFCIPEARCWYEPCDTSTAKCENRCSAKNTCPSDHYCMTEVGPCGDRTCRPVARCYPNPPENPCATVLCVPETVCWYNCSRIPMCENRCSSKNPCPKDYHCITETGPCGDSTCRPVAKCYPNNPCSGVECPKDEVCWYNKTSRKAQCYNQCLYTKCKAGYLRKTVIGSNGKPFCHCYNPCDPVKCKDGGVCYYDDTNTTQCVNPCAYTDCIPTLNCIPQPNEDPSQLPKAKCSRKYPPISCDGIKCPKKQKCTLVYTKEFPLVPICGPNPCISPAEKCCSVRDAKGVCRKDGCYLHFKNGSCEKTGEPCQVKQTCEDPCVVENVKCDVPGEYCYKDVVQCFVAPCNPVTSCRKPCGSQTVCSYGQNCTILYPNCLPGYPCQPQELCIKK